MSLKFVELFLAIGAKYLSIQSVGKISPGNVMIGTVVRRSLVAEIDRRRGLLNDTSRSEFVKLILEYWFSKGCPAVNEPDRLMLVATGGVKK